MWLFPVGLAIHDFEEAFAMPAFFSSHAEELGRIAAAHPLIGFLLHEESGSSALTLFAICLVVALSFGITALAFVHKGKGPWMFFYEVVLGMATLHVFIHIGQAVYFRAYVPGLVDAVLVLLPFCVAVYRRLFIMGGITIGRAVFSATIGIVLFVPTAFAAVSLAAMIF